LDSKNFRYAVRSSELVIVYITLVTVSESSALHGESKLRCDRTLAPGQLPSAIRRGIPRPDN